MKHKHHQKNIRRQVYKQLMSKWKQQLDNPGTTLLEEYMVNTYVKPLILL